MNAQHPAAPVHECGLEAALQQMRHYMERLRVDAPERGASTSSADAQGAREVLASDAEPHLPE